MAIGKSSKFQVEGRRFQVHAYLSFNTSHLSL